MTADAAGEGLVSGILLRPAEQDGTEPTDAPQPGPTDTARQRAAQPGRRSSTQTPAGGPSGIRCSEPSGQPWERGPRKSPTTMSRTSDRLRRHHLRPHPAAATEEGEVVKYVILSTPTPSRGPPDQLLPRGAPGAARRGAQRSNADFEKMLTQHHGVRASSPAARLCARLHGTASTGWDAGRAGGDRRTATPRPRSTWPASSSSTSPARRSAEEIAQSFTGPARRSSC